jgi:hypothetical protein
MKKAISTLSILAAAALAGCGDAGPSGPPKAPVERGVFISTSDCAASGKLSLDACGAVIDAAVAMHDRQAPAYASLRQCTAAEGANRCDKSVDGKYRSRLQAFFVTMGNPPSALPLYPAPSGKVGFRSISRQLVDVEDESLRVSVAAITLAHENAKLPAM